MLFAVVVVMAASLVVCQAQPGPPRMCPAMMRCHTGMPSRDPVTCRANAAQAKACVEGVLKSSDVCQCDVSSLVGMSLSFEQMALMCERSMCQKPAVASCVSSYMKAQRQSDRSTAAEVAACLPKQPVSALSCFSIAGPFPMSDEMLELARGVVVKSMRAIGKGCNLDKIGAKCQGPVLQSSMMNPCSAVGALDGMRQCMETNLQAAGDVCAGIEDAIEDSMTLFKHVFTELCSHQQKIKNSLANCVNQSTHARMFRRGAFPFF